MKKKWMAAAAALLVSAALSAEKITLEIKKEELREQNGKILFEPARRVMKAKYDTYVFDKKNFESIAGKMAKLPESFKLDVESKPGSVKTVNPKEGAVPEGGIKTRYFEATALKKGK